MTMINPGKDPTVEYNKKLMASLDKMVNEMKNDKKTDGAKMLGITIILTAIFWIGFLVVMF